MFAENLDVFLADFGVLCSKGTSTFTAILDAPDTSLNFGGSGVISTDYEITLKTADVQAISLVNRDAITVNGINFIVRDVMALDDAAFSKASLSKV